MAISRLLLLLFTRIGYDTRGDESSAEDAKKDEINYQGTKIRGEETERYDGYLCAGPAPEAEFETTERPPQRADATLSRYAHREIGVSYQPMLM
jgi:hypothetical protein